MQFVDPAAGDAGRVYKHRVHLVVLVIVSIGCLPFDPRRDRVHLVAAGLPWLEPGRDVGEEVRCQPCLELSDGDPKATEIAVGMEPHLPEVTLKIT